MLRYAFVTLSLVLCLNPPVRGDEKKLAELAQARYQAAEKAYKAFVELEKSQTRPFTDMLYHLSVRLLQAQLDLHSATDKHVAAYKAHLDRMLEWETQIKLTTKPASASSLVVESYRVEAEYWLEKAKNKSTK